MQIEKMDRTDEDTAKGVTWYDQHWSELYWSNQQQEPRRLSIFQYNADGEELGFGKAGTWGYAWYDIDGSGFATEDDARAAAMAAAPDHWGALTPMEPE